MATITVIRHGKKGHYKMTHSSLPGQTFGPWDLPETIMQVRVVALMSPMDARNMVMDAAVHGSATTETRD